MGGPGGVVGTITTAALPAAIVAYVLLRWALAGYVAQELQRDGGERVASAELETRSMRSITSRG